MGAELSGLSDLITTLGVPLGLIIWIAIGIMNLVNKQAPAVLERYQARVADQTEHVQSLEEQKLRHELRRDELQALTEAGARTFTEEQLTHHLSEVYGEFAATNEFVRKAVMESLRRIEAKLDTALIDKRDFLEMKERLGEIRMYSRASYDYLEATNDEENSSNLSDPIPVSGATGDTQS